MKRLVGNQKTRPDASLPRIEGLLERYSALFRSMEEDVNQRRREMDAIQGDSRDAKIIIRCANPSVDGAVSIDLSHLIPGAASSSRKTRLWENSLKVVDPTDTFSMLRNLDILKARLGRVGGLYTAITEKYVKDRQQVLSSKSELEFVQSAVSGRRQNGSPTTYEDINKKYLEGAPSLSNQVAGIAGGGLLGAVVGFCFNPSSVRSSLITAVIGGIVGASIAAYRYIRSKRKALTRL
jgi:hypothetical protein